jgi:hypothetical protein
MKTVTVNNKNMKNILILFAIMFTTITYCQNPILPITTSIGSGIPDGAYLKDINNDLDKFEGTWRYVSGNDTLTINLQKFEQNFNGDYYEDGLRGNYRYVKDGVLVMDYLNNSEPYIYGNIFYDNLNIMSLYLRDPERKRLSYEFILTHIKSINPSIIQLNWELKIMQVGYCGPARDNPAPPPSECLTDSRLPSNIVLEKVN